jgi:hypothetical protein
MTGAKEAGPKGAGFTRSAGERLRLAVAVVRANTRTWRRAM